MRNNYWNRLRNKDKIQVTKKVRRVEFDYKGETYIYEYTSTAAYGFGVITSRDGTIYSQHPDQCTDLGKELYEKLQKEKLI
jgi:hypothetical protein